MFESLSSNVLDDYTDTFGYDLSGNRLEYKHDSSVAADDKTVTYNYDDNDRLLVETEYDDLDQVIVATTTLYEYGDSTDPQNGIGGDGTQQTKKTVWQGADTDPGSGTKLSETTYGYNNQGRLKQVDIDEDADSNPDTITEYEYNDQGIRVSQSVNGSKTLYLIDGNNHTGYAQVLEEIAAASGALLKSYLLGHDVLAQYDSTNGLLNLLSDGHGSTRQLVDAMGAPVSSGGAPQIYTYNAYGELLAFTGTPVTSILYSGEFSDAATGLQYLRARYYDPQTGRFNRFDPFVGDTDDPQSLHKYLYATSNPIEFVDPTGLVSLTESLSVTNVQSRLANILMPAIRKAAKQVAKKIGCEIGEYLAFEGIYVFIANGAFYVGQSGNIARRLVEHKRDFGKAFEGVAAVLEFVPGLDKDRASKFVREIVEKVFIDGLLEEGLDSANTYNPVSPRNAAKRLNRHLGKLTKTRFKEIFGKVADKFKICEKVGGKPSLVDFVF